MKVYVNIFIILLAVFFQITILPHLGIFGIYPNLILLGIIILIFIGREQEALWWVLLGGIFLDFFSPVRFGGYTISFIIVYFSLTLILKYYFAQPSFLNAFWLIVTVSIISGLIFSLLTWQFSILIFLEAILNGILGIIGYWFISHYLKVPEEIKI